jgi:hypothetical protein
MSDWGSDERVFDQPCKYEERLGGHSTYCKNPCLASGRCEWRLYVHGVAQ